MSRVFIIHGWGGGPDKDWMLWLAGKLGDKKYEVVVPPMPNPDVPNIESWVDKLVEIVGNARKTDTFIGHSIGCQSILRFLESLPSGHKVDKVILVAPWLEIDNIRSKKMLQIVEPWLKTPIDFSRVIGAANQFITIFSDNDPWVPIKINTKLFKEKLDPKVVVLRNKGHFSEDGGVWEIPELLSLI